MQVYNVILSHEAKNDLFEIKKYIEDELQNPTAAIDTVSKITNRIRMLEEHAYAGAMLAAVADIRTDYRFLVCGNYICFYRVVANDVYIDRVLNSRQNYMRIIFGEG